MESTEIQKVRELLRDVPDFPKPGIIFKDITPILQSPEAFLAVANEMCSLVKMLGGTKLLAIESRGFLFGAAIAPMLGLPLVLARKPGKLPCETVRATYSLEYGEDALEVHRDALQTGDRVIIIDDLLATGGTAEAVCLLVESLGAEVAGCIFLVELCALGGVSRLANWPVHALLRV